MEHDVLGNALLDHLHGRQKSKLLLHTSYGEIEEMPTDEFFRQPEEFPELEYIALALCDGKTLDVGAGAGSHALDLQHGGTEVHALDLSPRACEVMRHRGVAHVIEGDIFAHSGNTYDTLLFLMNGIGLAGNLDGLKKLLHHCKSLLNTGGQLLFDSSDINYLYADGTVEKPGSYYGEIGYQYEYEQQKGIPFNWLFIDQGTLIRVAHLEEWVVQVLHEDEYGQYLARMTPRV